MDIYYSNELYHFGILGQKWGIRNYQNKNGSLTEAGRKRYGSRRDAFNKLREGKLSDAGAYGDTRMLMVPSLLKSFKISWTKWMDFKARCKES